MTWTTQKPTQPGEYWLSIEPGKREAVRKALGMMPPPTMEVWGLGADAILDGFWWEDNALDDDWLDGAKWKPRETPADPFADPQPDEIERLTAALRRAESERDAQHEQVLRLTAERDELQRRIDRIMDPPIKRLNVADGEMNVSLDAPEMASIIATAFWDCLDEHNAENYVEMTCAKPDKPLKKIVITARKLIGRTPDELKRAAERERDELLEKVKELESTRDLLLAENARLQERCARDNAGVIIHECPPPGEGVMPCCGATPFEHRNDRMTKEARLVNCDRMRLLTRVGELKSENLLLTKERDAARAQADELLALRAKEGWMP